VLQGSNKRLLCKVCRNSGKGMLHNGMCATLLLGSPAAVVLLPQLLLRLPQPPPHCMLSLHALNHAQVVL
jgi:hypothetical protein